MCYQKAFRNHNNLNCDRIFCAKRQLSLIPLNRTAALLAVLSNLTRPCIPVICGFLYVWCDFMYVLCLYYIDLHFLHFLYGFTSVLCLYSSDLRRFKDYIMVICGDLQFSGRPLICYAIIMIVLYSMPAAGRLTTQLAYRQYNSIVG